MTRQTVGSEERDGDLTVAGAVAVGDGSASAPSVTNDGDTNTGVFFPAADTVAVTTGGTERLRIDSNGLITGTGTSLGAWTTYTPTLGGTGWALGDGTVNGAYCQIGKIVAVFVRVLMGSSTTFGGVSPTISLPVTNSTRAANQPVVKGRVTDASLGKSYEVTGLTSSGTAVLSYLGSDGEWTAITSTAPFAFANGDFVTLGFTYEAA